MQALGYTAGLAVNVAATASSVAGSIVVARPANAIRVTNTSATLHVAFRVGSSAQTAVLTTDMVLAPLQSVIIGANEQTTSVAAIGSAAGPTTVNFCPVRDDN